MTKPKTVEPIWVACSEKEFGPVGIYRHLLTAMPKPNATASTTICGATAMPGNGIWRRNSTKPDCKSCVDIAAGRKTR